jgi:hypothetical protein
MKRWALIEGNIVANVVEQDIEPTIGGQWVDITGQHVGPGDSYAAGVFTPAAPPPPIITKIAMLTRLTDAEYVGILTAAKTDVAVEAWKAKFDAAGTINLDDQRTKDGIALLVTKNLLTQARADAILTGPVQNSERP